MLWINLKNIDLGEGSRHTACDFTEMPRRGKSKGRVDCGFLGLEYRMREVFLRKGQKAIPDEYRAFGRRDYNCSQVRYDEHTWGLVEESLLGLEFNS